jgi:hypothetical protein
MGDGINSLGSNNGKNPQKYNFDDKEKKENKDKKKSSPSKIRDTYLSKEKTSQPEYSRDPKIRKLLQIQANKFRGQRKS